MLGIFTPGKLANAKNQGIFLSRKPVGKHFPRHRSVRMCICSLLELSLHNKPRFYARNNTSLLSSHFETCYVTVTITRENRLEQYC